MSINPEKRRANDRARYARLKADPERYAAFLARQKAQRQARRAAGLKFTPRPDTHVPYDMGRHREHARKYKNSPAAKRARLTLYRRVMEERASRPRPAVCENCGTVGKRGVVFDHDHSTGEFRGWLCDNCNRALGLLNDDMERILGLALYLETHRCGPKGLASADRSEVKST